MLEFKQIIAPLLNPSSASAGLKQLHLNRIESFYLLLNPSSASAGLKPVGFDLRDKGSTPLLNPSSASAGLKQISRYVCLKEVTSKPVFGFGWIETDLQETKTPLNCYF